MCVDVGEGLPHTTKQFSATKWLSHNSTQFWHYLPRNSVRFHKLTWWLSGKESPSNAGDTDSFLCQKLTWRRKWQPTPVFLLEKPHRRGAWWTTVYRIIKSQTHSWRTEHTPQVKGSAPQYLLYTSVKCKLVFLTNQLYTGVREGFPTPSLAWLNC